MNRSNRLGLAIIAALAGTFFAARSSADDEPLPAEEPGFRNKIVLFGATRPTEPGKMEILTLNPDGTGLASVLALKDVALMNGRISPDGRRLACGAWRTEGGRERASRDPVGQRP